MRKPYAVGLCLSYPKNAQGIWCTDIKYEHEVPLLAWSFLVASQLSFCCHRTPAPYLFSLRAALSPSSPSFSHPLNPSHFKTFLVLWSTIFQTLPVLGSCSLAHPDHRHSFWHWDSCAPLLHFLHPVGVAAATPSHTVAGICWYLSAQFHSCLSSSSCASHSDRDLKILLRGIYKTLP